MQPYELLRQIPALDVLWKTRRSAGAPGSIQTARCATRCAATSRICAARFWKRRILPPMTSSSRTGDKARRFLPAIQERLREAEEPILRPMINATGICCTRIRSRPLGAAPPSVYDILRTYLEPQYDLKADAAACATKPWNPSCAS